MNTAHQLALLADPLDERFLDFHHAHPEVYERIVELARKWRDAGHEKIGIATIFEVMRWERGLRGVKDAEGFRLNNSYRSRYARIIMANEKDLVGFFDTRTLESDRGW